MPVFKWSSRWQTSVATIIALIAFAGNSVLCRLALAEQQMNAAAFTSVRLFSGALMLSLLLGMQSRKNTEGARGSWYSGGLLFIYASCFSFAYLYLDTGIGALILFAAVQLSMIGMAVLKGARLHLAELLGVILAFSGLLWLLIPSNERLQISPLGFSLMAVAGIAWGLYSLKGRDSVRPRVDTTFNFLRSLPFLLLLIPYLSSIKIISSEALLLALLSGAIASGLGYWIWYIALAGLSASQAAVVQLLVPIIAASGGWVFANESLDPSFVLSASLVLGGILLTIFAGRQRSPSIRK
ncbi:DMT family transporter [Agarivorans sp. QJM3NY_25]|uniref:DMT family transporter n=1 Tax=Agarivorans sp. QJM3NY_25 TaxID=3421430 RepID=UPI003D7DE773